MKRILLGLAMVALLTTLVVASIVPAIARDRNHFGFFRDDGVSLETENEAESGDVQLNNQVSNEGDYAMQCTPALQFGQTGNLNNSPAFLQYASEADDFEPGGIEFAIEPTVSTDCEQSVQQSSAASS